jgi:hypothetical protein
MSIHMVYNNGYIDSVWNGKIMGKIDPHLGNENWRAQAPGWIHNGHILILISIVHISLYIHIYLYQYMFRSNHRCFKGGWWSGWWSFPYPTKTNKIPTNMMPCWSCSLSSSPHMISRYLKTSEPHRFRESRLVGWASFLCTIPWQSIGFFLAPQGLNVQFVNWLWPLLTYLFTTCLAVFAGLISRFVQHEVMFFSRWATALADYFPEGARAPFGFLQKKQVQIHWVETYFCVSENGVYLIWSNFQTRIIEKP